MHIKNSKNISEDTKEMSQSQSTVFTAFVVPEKSITKIFIDGKL